jgi:uncharacterized membrane protein
VLGERRVRAVTSGGTDPEASGAPAPAVVGPRPLPVLERRLERRLGPWLRGLAPPPGSAWRDPVTWAIALTVLGAYFALSLFRLLQLTPGSYDLGIYVEYVKQVSQLHAPIGDILAPGFNLLGNHFQVAVGVIAPFFRLFPSAATLLFFQALCAAVAVFPVVTAARVFTGRSTGRLIGFAFGFSWGLQQMVEFDFHEIALAVPLIAFSVSALARRRPVAAVAWAVPLVFVEESQGFTVAAIGMVLGAVMAFRPSLPSLGWGNVRFAPWGGLFLVAWGLFWSAFAVIVIIPHFNPLHQYYFWKDGGAVGGGQPFSVGSLLTQAGAGWPTKAQTVALLLLPTAFAALGSPVALIALPSLALRFISANTAYWGTDFHYDATIMPVLFIAAAEAIGRWRRASALAWPLAAAGAADSAGAGAADSAGAGGPAAGDTAADSPRAGRPGWLRWPALTLPGLEPLRELAFRAREVLRSARAGVARHGGAMMAIAAVALAFQFPLSNLWHASTYRLDAHIAAADAAMAAVPDGATVQATLDLLAPLAARTDTFWIGTPGNPLTQYIVFDGPDSGYSPQVTNVPGFIAQLYPNAGYATVFARDGVYVFRRG